MKPLALRDVEMGTTVLIQIPHSRMSDLSALHGLRGIIVNINPDDDCAYVKITDPHSYGYGGRLYDTVWLPLADHPEGGWLFPSIPLSPPPRFTSVGEAEAWLEAHSG